MNQTTIDRLLSLNRQFYQTFALQFSATRQRLQPGVWRVLESLPKTARLLDLGCGNGELWQELSQRGFSGVYVGLDFSPGLLEVAREKLSDQQTGTPSPGPDPQAVFLQADLSSSDWDAPLSALPSPLSPPYDLVLAFAVLHHLPGHRLRRLVLEKSQRLLSPGGRFIHSEWQFLNSLRLRLRIQPWETAGLSEAELDPGDYLLDWRHGGSGLRYVHHFDPAELQDLAERTGFRILETFHSDGEGGNLGLYQIWEKREARNEK